jgi:hypothetical protein
MSTKFIEAAWEGYRKMVVPSDASEVQVVETRQAFFSGAAVLFEVLIRSASHGDEVLESDILRMKGIQAEIDEFGQALDAKLLNPLGRQN